MFIRSTSGAGGLALALALVAPPAFAQTPAAPQISVADQAMRQDCVRRVAPPSPNPHDVFRRIVCVPRNATTVPESRRPHRRPPVVPREAVPQPLSSGLSQPDQGVQR